MLPVSPITISQLKTLQESEDKVEFKEGKESFSYKSGKKSILGYIAALANQKGGYLVFGMKDAHPHEVCGTKLYEGQTGKLEQEIFRDLNIHVNITEQWEATKRVLIIAVPSRPNGKAIYHEDIALMRVGDQLSRMSDEVYHSIIQEQEPDFSARICSGLQLSDLDQEAIAILKEYYSERKQNPAFRALPTEQVLSDLDLYPNGQLTYAALLLLGQPAAIKQYLPQACIIWEFRYNEHQIPHDFREQVCMPLFKGIDVVWGLIEGKNAQANVLLDAVMKPIRVFNREVIREAVLNAVAHRDYTITSEVVIKQYPKKIIISNPGGFPKGVSLDNLLTVNSTPRSRLMTDVMEKTGLVERSGQGIDKIFSFTLAEGKPLPSYQDSSLLQVTLQLSGIIEDEAFFIFLRDIQKNRSSENQLSALDIIHLYKIKQGLFKTVTAETLRELERNGLITREGGHSLRYTLPAAYQALSNKEQNIGTRYIVPELSQFLMAIQLRELSIGALEELLAGSLNRNQIKYLINKLYEDSIITSTGSGRGTKYLLRPEYGSFTGDALLGAVVTWLRTLYG